VSFPMGCLLTAFGRRHHSVIYKPFLYELRHQRRFRSRSARTTANGAPRPSPSAASSRIANRSFFEFVTFALASRRRATGWREGDAPLRVLSRPNGLRSYGSGSAVHPDHRDCVCSVGAEGSACRSRWCCGPASERGTPQARGSSRRLLYRWRFRIRDPSRKPSFFPESSRRCPNNARRQGFEAAALETVSIWTCSCCPPIRPAASTDCRIRAAT